MNVSPNGQRKRGKRLEAIKWIVVVALLFLGIIGNQFYQDVMLPLRTFLVIFLFLIAGGVALLTKKGKTAITFSREAYSEIQKVIWPTRQEALQTTLIVSVVTVAMSLILWGLDIILVRLVSFITGLRF